MSSGEWEEADQFWDNSSIRNTQSTQGEFEEPVIEGMLDVQKLKEAAASAQKFVVDDTLVRLRSIADQLDDSAWIYETGNTRPIRFKLPLRTEDRTGTSQREG